MKIKYFGLMLFLCAFQNCNQKKDASQQSLLKEKQSEISFSRINEKERIDWKKIEVTVSETERSKAVEKLKKHFEYIFNNEYYSGQPFERTIHFLDLNGDKVLDVIVEGYSGAESDNTQIFLAENNDFKKVLEKSQYVKSIKIKDGQLESLTMLDFGCCAEYVEYETKYKITSSFSATPINQKAIASFEKKPKNSFLKKPKSIFILQENTALRSSPIFDDTSTVIYDSEGTGNVLAKYPENSPGFAWVSETDSNGKKWWYVEIQPVKSVKESLLYQKDDIPTNGMGWMREDQFGVK
ncbi:hypothetical protein I5M27_04205 [Adhaeribacter sp. BT258]|uniref:Uncharacterized protein n=1 Tax=Adhaeribacter terrigena TaxID=2793070 RepID=A0ABS1BYQ2_9BACT|nr:hypothetical protein [Adhaeribacter terrigena]MBK0402173.1 hypothetical protein [Adhaeribacter terrigena]